MANSIQKSLKSFSGISKKIHRVFLSKKSKSPKLKTEIKENPVRKKVLMFGWELPPYNSGGLGVACHDMAESIAKQNTDITFILPKKQPINSDFMKVNFAEEADPNFKSYLEDVKNGYIKNNFSIQEIDSLLSPYLTSDSYHEKLKSFLNGLGLWQRFLNIFGHKIYGSDLISEVYRYGESAAKIVKMNNYDVIHAHDWLAYPAGVIAKKISNKPLVVHVHALEYDRSSENSVDRRICKIERLGLEKADKVIAISHYIKDRVMKFYQIPAEKIEVVHNGITIREKPEKKVSLPMLKQSGKKMVLFVGRITYQKGVDYIISAASRISKIDPNVVFMIVGSGDMHYQIIRQAASLGISDKVFFPGFLRGQDLKNIYKAADLFVMPSVSEPFGLVALEAMAYKVPIIISKQSGCAEVIDHGLKVDFWDVDELANKIISVLRYSSLRKSLSENGYQNALACTWDDAATKCLRIYNSLTNV